MAEWSQKGQGTGLLDTVIVLCKGRVSKRAGGSPHGKAVPVC